MAVLQWDQTGQRFYETGVDRGVLYIPNAAGDYVIGYAWNGLTAVTETPSGAESNPQYADNIKYVDLISAEEFGGTIEAFTYPDQFAQCDGTATPSAGVSVGQQSRKTFGLSYRTKIGNDINQDLGYKLHLIYGALAAPSEKAYATVNDSPEALTFSWEFSTTGAVVSGLKPTSLLVIDSTKVTPANLSALENFLYGTAGTDPSLPLPGAVLALFSGAVTLVDLSQTANAPSYNTTTKVVTLPTVAGVTWRINGTVRTPGAQPALTTGQTSVVTAHLAAGYAFHPNSDDDWTFSF